MKRNWLMVAGVLVALALIALAWPALSPAPSAPGGTASARATRSVVPQASTTKAAQPRGSQQPSSTQPKGSQPGGQATDPATRLRWVGLAELPREASDTMANIKAGPPYPRNDGVVYHNNNRVLPVKPDGYYHEFTVKTPGESDRGARRIIAGGPDRGQANGEYFYTADHYNSFERIRP